MGKFSLLRFIPHFYPYCLQERSHEKIRSIHLLFEGVLWLSFHNDKATQIKRVPFHHQLKILVVLYHWKGARIRLDDSQRRMSSMAACKCVIRIPKDGAYITAKFLEVSCRRKGSHINLEQVLISRFLVDIHGMCIEPCQLERE